jgi:hypothetical protein
MNREINYQLEGFVDMSHGKMTFRELRKVLKTTLFQPQIFFNLKIVLYIRECNLHYYSNKISARAREHG